MLRGSGQSCESRRLSLIMYQFHPILCHSDCLQCCCEVLSRYSVKVFHYSRLSYFITGNHVKLPRCQMHNTSRHLAVCQRSWVGWALLRWLWNITVSIHSFNFKDVECLYINLWRLTHILGFISHLNKGGLIISRTWYLSVEYKPEVTANMKCATVNITSALIQLLTITSMGCFQSCTPQAYNYSKKKTVC